MIAGLPCKAFLKGEPLRQPTASGAYYCEGQTEIRDTVSIERLMIKHSYRFLIPWIFVAIFGVCALTPLIGRAQKQLQLVDLPV
jgi:hypothetical protein